MLGPVPDRRRHRGPHPGDADRFAPPCLPRLAAATADLSLLLGRGCPKAASLKLCGDRHDLDRRQRIAVRRCACSDRARADRQGRCRPLAAIGERPLWIDGFNVLTTIEAALSGGVILCARDGTFRDMASMHGSYRKVTETRPAIEAVRATLSAHGIRRCRFLLDSPVSNSGRLRQVLLDVAAQHGDDWQVELVADPDALLVAAAGAGEAGGRDGEVIATADSVVLDRCGAWLNLARHVVETRVPSAWRLDLSCGGDELDEVP